MQKKKGLRKHIRPPPFLSNNSKCVRGAHQVVNFIRHCKNRISTRTAEKGGKRRNPMKGIRQGKQKQKEQKRVLAGSVKLGKLNSTVIL